MMLTSIENKLGEILESPSPVDIEIGFGKGRFILDKARIYKNINFIGFEVKVGLVEYVKNIINQENLPNIYVERAYADLAIPEKIPAGRVRNIFINFPDPWWKRRHKKRRILRKEFINLFYNILMTDGTIYVRTDVKEYAEFVSENFAGFDTFVPVEHDNSDNIMSNREVRCQDEGLDIYYLAFRKITPQGENSDNS
jgi:tRNA (guanine-N7-)-methyltransferase